LVYAALLTLVAAAISGLLPGLLHLVLRWVAPFGTFLSARDGGQPCVHDKEPIATEKGLPSDACRLIVALQISVKQSRLMARHE
jgi:hypothetical protein